MSDPRLISPMLDNFIMGEAVSNHHGVQCCPAMEKETDDKYIVKIISVPANPAQMDALLLSGAYENEAAALAYYKDVADGILAEVDILRKLSEQEGFIPFDSCQMEPMESGKGYDIYLLSRYKRPLDKHFKRHNFTHLDALNLGLDLCAALGVCRRSGYLYVDLKPGNVYVTENLQYRIGDLGFVPLNSLKYTSLPEKYRSEYTPAEIDDAYASLNTTMDIYAVGLILYQAYNDGALPFHDDILPGDRLPAPMFADYEMSEIILKACDPNPDARWQDPMQLGQAIVSYMQRNGAKDTPIIPVPEPAEEETPESVPEIPAVDNTEEAQVQASFVEDEFGNITFLSDVDYAEAGLTEDDEDYEALSGEVSDILNQADELATISVPEPVVVPDHIDLPEPDPIEPEPEPEPEEPAAVEEVPEQPTPEETPAEEVEEAPESTDIKKSHWLRNCVTVLILAAIVAGGIWFYRQYYLLPIHSIRVEGSESSLTVHIDTEIDESLLEVVCIDTYGNQIPAPVINGKAEFTGLLPNTAYNIKVTADGFHRLIGSTTTAYSTPIQTNIVQFDAITGVSDGSVILSFTVEGPDCDQWKVHYFADGEAERSATFNSHMVSLSDLTIGKEYTFRLVPGKDLFLSGLEEIKFTARKLVRAENLEIVSCVDNTLVAKWNAPEGADVSGWTVSCTGANYNQTVTTTDTTVTFRDLDHTAAYTVEVKASYMSLGEKAVVSANSVTVMNFNADTSNPAAIILSWEPSQIIPADGWVLHYSIAGIDVEETIPCDQNTVAISPVIPNATYRVWLTDTSGNVLLSSRHTVTSQAPSNFNAEFDEFQITKDDLEFLMCKLEEKPDWKDFDPAELNYTTTFATGETASLLATIKKENSDSTQGISLMYVLRNQDGTLMNVTIINTTWKDMWHGDYCLLSLPIMPSDTGSYIIEVYFNGGLAVSNTLAIA